MYFTPQQLSGGPKYSSKTRVGNWSEELDLSQHNQRNYLDKKDKGRLMINETQKKFAKSFQRVPHTYSHDGQLKFGDNVMLMNKQTNGFMVFDMGDKITGTADEAYACTTTPTEVGPCGRSICSIEKANNEEGDNVVRYGEQVRFVTNPYVFHKPLYLHSTQCTPQVFARFSRNLEVCLCTKNVYNTVWRIVPQDGNGSPLIGQPVQANAQLIIEHCATKEFLSSDKINYGNQYGMEYEVSAKKAAAKQKSQQLSNERVGKTVIDLTIKPCGDQNIWQILTALDPSAAEPVAAPEELSYDGATLVRDIRATLGGRGSLTIRGLAQMFKSLDNNKNKSLDADELENGLRDFGINLNTEQVGVLVKFFDKDGSGSINFNEFLTAIRGQLNDMRTSYIREAYKKLDVNKDGLVKLDDIAKIYDVSQHPEIVQGTAEPKDVFMQYMSLWDTQQADGIITFSEFCDYYRDISASIDEDAYFAAMMTSAWKL